MSDAGTLHRCTYGPTPLRLLMEGLLLLVVVVVVVVGGPVN